jgi:Raf kinase inhibitor-like YbhB/YbcL family protein
MGLAQQIEKGIGKAMAPIRAGNDKLASRKLGLTEKMRTLEVKSSAFPERGTLPLAFTSDGSGIAPPIAWSNVPESARSIVLLAEDPDAPYPRPFVHWLVYSLPVTATSIETAPAGAHEGKNSLLKNGFAPAAPPPGHGLHHYHFQVFALDTIPQLEAGAGRRALIDAMRNHVVAWGETVGTYERG